MSIRDLRTWMDYEGKWYYSTLQTTSKFLFLSVSCFYARFCIAMSAIISWFSKIMHIFFFLYCEIYFCRAVSLFLREAICIRILILTSVVITNLSTKTSIWITSCHYVYKNDYLFFFLFHVFRWISYEI